MVQKTVVIAGWTSTPTPDEVAFDAIKSGIDALPQGVKMFLNGGAFYSPDGGPANVQLIARFFEKYPEYADRAFLSIKGANSGHGIDCSPENLRRSVDEILAALRGTKRLDLFEPARIDSKVAVEDMMKTLAQLRNEGKYDYIGLSECSAATLRRAHAVHPVAVAEIEISPFAYEDETKRVIAAAKELDIAIAAYSPLGSGLLTGSITNSKDLPEGDMRRNFSRFQEDVMQANKTITDSLKAIAERKRVSLGQLCIAWVGYLGDHIIPLPGSSHKKRTLENLEGGNIDLTLEELGEINLLLSMHKVQGERYMGGEKATLWG
ncbi:Aldo/keto reductase [Obba rivulosa]|uniref:Aldo/keto reductase n=1 Tax=Obba rivulosa TaxID=1052685 RepID=A0A8E2ATG7_9APHY|nr:Aldo/keto reductase [Obba rivulosa]